jgi:uncharacterized protein with GYD domain
MARYVALINWTPQGAANYRNSLDRAAAADELFGSFGGSLVDIYWTLGQYDIVAISEFPDDETATAALLRLAEGGNVRTTTMRAFDRADIGRIIEKSTG